MSRSVHIASVCLATLALLAAPTLAHAQPGQTTPPPPRYKQPPRPSGPPPSPWRTFHPRYGLTVGGSFGLGGMTASSGPIRCDGCSYAPLATGFDIHMGGMLNPRLALFGELSSTVRQLDDFGAELLYQVQVLAAAQFWVLPIIWVKGGVGVSWLGIRFDDGFFIEDDTQDTGTALMLAVGVELYSSPHWAIDLQLRGAMGSYNALDDRISSGHIQLGFSWF